LRTRVVVAACLVACSRGATPAPDRGAALVVVGESTKLRAAEALPATSAIFDGTTVRVRGARGEVLGVQVLRAATSATTVSLAVDGARVDGFAVALADVRRPSTMMYGPSRGRGQYPDRLTPTEGPVPTTREAYFDLAIDRDGAPGLHRGTLTVGDAQLAVELTVDAYQLPDLGAAPRVWGYYDDGMAGADAMAPMFRAHGVVVSPDVTPATWPARRAQLAGLPFVPVLLPRDSAGLARDVAWWARALAGTDQVPFAIPIDEPRSLLAQVAVRLRAREVRAAGGGPGRFLYAVTHAPTAILGDEIDVFIAPEPGAGQWTYNGTPPAAGSMILDTDGVALRTWGWIGFRHELPLWYVWDALFWADRYHRGRDAAPHDLLVDPVTFDDGEDHGNLDGVLAYPGGAPSLRLKALRRGQQDRLLLDGLAACAGRPAALAIVAPLVSPADWPVDESAWEAARRAVLDGLAACNPRR